MAMVNLKIFGASIQQTFIQYWVEGAVLGMVRMNKARPFVLNEGSIERRT